MTELPPTISPIIYVIDALGFIQRYQTLGAITFGELEEIYRRKIMTKKPAKCNEVHFIGDRYDFDIMSLKGDEWQRRGIGKTSPEYVPADNLKIPDWKTFLSNPRNKANLLKYLSSCWSKSSLPDGFTMVLGIEAQAICVTNNGETDHLRCPNHEEADTRIIAHIASLPEASKVVVQATDTNILNALSVPLSEAQEH